MRIQRNSFPLVSVRIALILFIVASVRVEGQQCTGTIRGQYNSWNYMQVVVESFPSNLQATANQALAGAASQWNNNCNADGVPQVILDLSELPIPNTYHTRFTIRYITGTHPDPGKTRVCGTYESSALAYVYSHMRTSTGLEPCPLGDPAKLRHIISHEIGHRFGLSDIGSSCSNYTMTPVPTGTDNSTVQANECDRAGSLNSTAEERSQCDHPFDCHQSPILINCRSRSWELSSLGDGVFFDFDGDGNLTRTAWTKKNSKIGFLYTDLDGSGCAETGGELFGDARLIGDGDLAANGFEALEAYDSSSDGMITHEDENWTDLRLWVDGSHDGECSPAETSSLDEAGVVAIELAYQSTTIADRHGNEFRFVSNSYCLVGSRRVERRAVYDVFFVTDGRD